MRKNPPKKKITERERELRRARQAKAKAHAKAEANTSKALRTELANTREAVKAVMQENKDLAAQNRRHEALRENLSDERAPLDLDHFVRAFEGEDADSMARSKRQEYNQLQGEFADFIADPEAFSDEAIRKLARYGAGLTEDEGRFTKRRAARIVAIQAARENLFLRNFTARASVLFKDKVVPKGYAVKRSNRSPNRIVTLHLSDLHVGARIDAKEFPRGSDAVSEARRLGMLIKETVEYKTRYRDQTTLHLLLNGDLIAGLLGHSNAREEDTLTEQFTRALHYLVQATTALASAFPQVKVFFQAGNHGRNILVHPGRATAAKHDSYENMIGEALRIACRPLANVTWDIPKTPYCAVPYFDKWALMTHGDTLVNVGNPASSVNVKSILGQINAINASRAFGRHFDVVVTGHVHTAMTLYYPGGQLIVNGAATPPGGHAVSLGFFDSCAQWLWESTPKYAVGDMRLLKLFPEVDADKSLETFVKSVA